MQKTVNEIIEMIENGELCYNQSTQRKFVYAWYEAHLPCGKTTKAGSLINAILEENIQLPALYFWDNTDTNQLNIHDGKQRVLSLYYFIKPVGEISITTIRNGITTSFEGLSLEDKEKLLNYTFDIVIRKGTSEEEEKSFYLINTNSINLTPYECVSGMLHGSFLSGFENYINARSNVLENVSSFNGKACRGDQAYKFLLAMFGLCDRRKSMSNDTSVLKLCKRIEAVRESSFDAKAYNFDKILNIFNDIRNIVKDIQEERAIAIAMHIIEKGYDAEYVIDYYRKSIRKINDIKQWDCDTHRTFIDAYIDGLELDPKRTFDKDIKDKLYTRDGRCVHIDEYGNRCGERNYSKLEIDHITPWSKGGRTILDNAQLLCKSHNSSKGNKL